ncbi:MAG TPA: IclR family transcriptional regulator [Nocardioidaceae bacterium]|nr:IclR family transcriptional regulator [Nocardioidaceae bacterium]
MDNALRLLLLFAEQPRIRLTDASTYLGVASSTAHRLLAMLQYRGFVRQDRESRAYEPGSALATIAFATIRQLDIRSRARPVLEALNAKVQETVHLGRLEATQAHFIDSIESPRAVRVVSRAGRAMPAHCTSNGKASLSLLSTQELHQLYPSDALETLTPRSLTSRTALEKDLKLVRRRGFATSNEESEEGVVSISMPVSSPSGVHYALTVSLPVHRMNPARRNEIVAALRDAVEELGKLVV